MHKAFAVGCLALMAGCTTIDSATLSWDNLTAETNRDLRQALYEIPFSEGPISIIVTESGKMRTYALRPCGATVCAGNARGTLTRTDDYWVVTGAYRGRTFYLSPGGDGYMLRNGAYFPLAWD